MMLGINRVTLIGNVGVEPDIHVADNKVMVARFSLATNERRKAAHGKGFVMHTEWHNIVLFGRLAKVTQDHIRKGALIYIEGKLQTARWTDDAGQPRYKTEILGNSLRFLTPRTRKGKRADVHDEVPAVVTRPDDMADDISDEELDHQAFLNSPMLHAAKEKDSEDAIDYLNEYQLVED